MSKLYVLDAIRAHLKARQLTYKDLALGLGLSEASVKRLFASADCSLERLEQICQFLQLEFADLFRSAPKKRALIAQLTHDQEVEFATHRHLLMVAVCALNRWKVADMWEHLHISPDECRRLLWRLDDIGFLEMQTEHQYRLRVAPTFSWITGGPIMQMVQGISHEYFNDPFDGEGEVLRIVNLRLSREAQVRLKKRLEQIAQEYVDQARADSHLPLPERPPISLCIAARAWIPEFMQDLIKQVDGAEHKTSRQPPTRATSSPAGGSSKGSGEGPTPRESSRR